MAKQHIREIESLKKQLENTKLQHKKEISRYMDKIEAKDREISEILNYFDMAIIDTTADMRILRTYGAAEEMFKPAKKMLEYGDDLIKAVFRTTHNSRVSSETQIMDNEEPDDLEKTITRFVEGSTNERIIHIVGEKDDGEIFQLIWIIVRHDKIFKSYFKIILTNQFIIETQEKYEKKNKEIRENAIDIFEMVSDGILVLDMENRIQFMSKKAYEAYLPNESRLLNEASFEGRLYKEIFVTETADEVQNRLDLNDQVILAKRPLTYKKNIGKKEIIYNINPAFNNKGNIIGLVIISSIFESEEKNDTKIRILKTLQTLTVDNKRHVERYKELELNEQWLMKKNSEYQDTIIRYYSFLENVPMPIGAIEIPSFEYVFVNNEFKKLLGMRRREIIGKTDAQLFEDVDEDTIINTNEKNLDSDNIFHINISNHDIVQKTIFGNEGQPLYIIRIFYKTMNK